MQLIAIEGGDAAGKRTQTRRLVDALRADNLRVLTVDFPRYGGFWGRMIKQYLHGQLGEFPPLAAALLYAADRAEFAPMLRAAASHYDVVVCDRYTFSNVAYQVARVRRRAYDTTDPVERARLDGEAERLREQILNIEFRQYQMPKPDLTIWLTADTTVTSEALRTRGEKLDRHEVDRMYQEAVHEEYATLAGSFDTGTWHRVCATQCGGWRDPDKIGREVYEGARKLLAR